MPKYEPKLIDGEKLRQTILSMKADGLIRNINDILRIIERMIRDESQ